MLLLSKELAIVGVVSKLADTVGLEDIRFTSTDVQNYNEYLDKTSGLAVVSNFSADSVESVLDRLSPVFTKDNDTYSVSYHFTSKDKLISWLTYSINPLLNYPIEVLQCVGLCPKRG